MHGTPFYYPVCNMRMLTKCCHGEMHVTLLNTMTKTIVIHQASRSLCRCVLNMYTSYALASLMGVSMMCLSWTLSGINLRQYKAIVKIADV